MLFFPFRDEERDLKDRDSYSLKLSDPTILEIVNKNKLIFEPNSDLVELALQAYREDVALNFDALAQQENANIIEEINLNNVEVEVNGK